ncbi:DedA family protein [Streptomyces sp. MK7]|uniref:DedA family protein n=1 Tax=Streptomyces sp. MK7 TaxID=3067635 RepID=UPI0037D9FD2A
MAGRRGIAVIVRTTLGSIGGSLVVYGADALLARDRTRAIVERIHLVKAHEIDKAEAWFARHGARTVFFARMVPVFGSLISVPAGIERMPLVTFIGFTALGSVIWNAAFALAGHWLGDNWHLVRADTVPRREPTRHRSTPTCWWPGPG